MNRNEQDLQVAQIGRLVGLRGELKLHINSDFPEQFKTGEVFVTQKNIELEIASYNPKRSLVLFSGYENRESAFCLVNSHLFTTMKSTLENCKLKKDEFFWFDIIGCLAKEGETTLGVISDIDRIGDVDYLVIKTDKNLLDKKLSKTFFIPYIDRYVISVKKEIQTVFIKDGLELLEHS